MQAKPNDNQEKKPQYFMKMALDLGRKALENGEVPVGCLFVREGEIIARAQNKTNEFMNATSHAEMVALKEMAADSSSLANCDLYVTIEPCIMCAAALRQVGIRHVYFGAFNDKFGGNGSVLNLHNDLHSPFKEYQITSGILGEEAIYLLRQFYVKENQLAPVPRKKTNRTLKPVEKLDYSK